MKVLLALAVIAAVALIGLWLYRWWQSRQALESFQQAIANASFADLLPAHR